jgi:hypothetical protein
MHQAHESYGLGIQKQPMIHCGPRRRCGSELTGVVLGGRFQWGNLTARGPRGIGCCGEPHHRQSWAAGTWDSTDDMLEGRRWLNLVEAVTRAQRKRVGGRNGRGGGMGAHGALFIGRGR